MTDAEPVASEPDNIAGERWLGPAILRVAGWPIETLDGLRSQQLTKQIDDWIEREEHIRRESSRLVDKLHGIIPSLGEREIRRLALELKRLLHSTLEPLPPTKALLANESVYRVIGPEVLACAAHRNEHAAERAEIEKAYAAELERAGGALDQIVSDERFQRALCLASSSVFRQWRNLGKGTASRRSRERLQSTLHRYLMRAVGRATPNGLWAGVVLEDMADVDVPLRVAARQSIIRVSPALAIFARGLEHMNRQRPWIEELTWRRNPTLRRGSDGAWQFGTFTEGLWSIRRIADHPQLGALVEQFALADRVTLRQIEIALRDRFPGTTSLAARKVCEFWIGAGILWSTACLPAVFADPWEGLDTLIETLPASQRPLWRDCRMDLRKIADKVETAIDTIGPEELRNHFDDARKALEVVLGRYDAVVAPSEDVLVVDRTAPIRFSMSRDLARQIEKELRQYWAFDRYGLGEIETRIAIDNFFGLLPRKACVPLGELLSRGSETDPTQSARSWQERVFSKARPDHALQAREAFARWDRELEPAVGRRIHSLAKDWVSSPYSVLSSGSALLLLGLSNRSAVLRIGGLTPEPCFFYSRFSHLFGSDDAFLAWQRVAVAADGSRRPELRFLDLAIRNHFNPNVTARPPVAADFIDPLDTDSALLREGAVGCNRNGRPLLFARAGADKLLVPSARSAAYLGGLDRFASVLASVSFFLGRPPLLAPIPRLAREIDDWHHLPRLTLDDAVISPERWTPDSSLGSMLASARGAERFVLWRRFVRTAGLPNLIYTFHGRHQTESLLATDSALAVELLGRELQAQGPSVRMQEVFPAPEDFAVRDQNGHRYVTELAVPWPADAAFWRDYADGAEPELGTQPLG
jgi:hypothetical protein